MNKQQFLSELEKLLVFMTDEDCDLVIDRIGYMFDLAGPEGEEAIAGMLGSPTRTAIRLSRGYEPGYIPELPEPEELTGQPVQPDPQPAEAAPDGTDAASEGEDLWEDLPAFELPDVEADGFVAVPTEDEPAPDRPEEPKAPEDSIPEDEGLRSGGEEDTPALQYIEPRMISHGVPDYGGLPDGLAPVREPPARYMPLWVGIPLFIIAILGLGIPLAPAAAVLFVVLPIPGVLLLIGGWLIFVGGLWCVAYIADAVMLFGAAFVCLGLGLMVLWLGLWLGVTIIKLYIRGIRALARVCLSRKEASRYA